MKMKCCDCCYPKTVDSEACGCCEGIEILTPLPINNRPGLSELRYRIGTHSGFLETMLARLSSSDFPELKGLTTREADDPSIALLDGWATIADVLTFYQERIANEGFLRTATERRSILELARLVGYKLRPGVSSSVFVSFTMDDNNQEQVTIPKGTRSQSIPESGEGAQTFETSEDLKARALWNNLKPRMTQPQTWDSIINNGTEDSKVQGPRVYLKGINTNLKSNDPLLIQINESEPEFSRVIEVFPDAAADRTLVTLKLTENFGVISDPSAPEEAFSAIQSIEKLTQKQLINDLTLKPSAQSRNALQLKRTLSEQFVSKANTGYGVVETFAPVLKDTLSTAAGNAQVTGSYNVKVYALRVKASLFAHNLPLPSCPDDMTSPPGLNESPDISCCLPSFFQTGLEVAPALTSNVSNFAHLRSDSGFELLDEVNPEQLLALDAEYKEIKQDSWAAVEIGASIEVFKVNQVTSATLGGLLEGPLSFFSTCPPVTVVSNISRGFGVSIGEATKIKSTVLVLDGDWRQEQANNILRNAVFFGQSEELELSEEPIEKPICGGTEEDLIELDGFYEGLESGRWVVVSGERNIGGTSGVRFSELAMLGTVTQYLVTETSADSPPSEDDPRPGEKIHTFIKLANELAFCFKRDTVTIHGNVVKATHGETQEEVLGSGDGGKALQAFELKQKPLTFISAPNPDGVDSTLEVYVNEIHWHEADTLTDKQATDRNFYTQTDNEDKTRLIFGNGRQGARLPTGIENIKAKYRSGIGQTGNVKAGQISLLKDRPLGVKEVVNPLRASGGADREGRDQARQNAPLAIKALDRLVSVQDYEDFSRVYAGIGKARAEEMSDGRRQLVHVTIAGADDIPIDTNSDLYINLRKALHDFGDPFQPIELAVRELLLIVISANVRILPDYQWEPVVTAVRDNLLQAFSFERRELGQDVLLSEVISVMQSVRGVDYIDVDTLGGIPEKINDDGVRRLLTPDEITEAVDCFSARDTEESEGLCQKLGNVETTQGVRQRIRVNVAAMENGVIRPAQLAFLTPEVAETLILNQIE